MSITICPVCGHLDSEHVATPNLEFSKEFCSVPGCTCHFSGIHNKRMLNAPLR